jgi:uncharacterized protein (DUF433 family)
MASASFDWKQVSGIGLYTVPLASRLLSEKPVKVRAWLEGYPSSEAEPIIVRQLPQIGGRTVFGFLDLVEARFVKHFVDLGLSPQSIRKVAKKLRAKHHEDHPFATNRRFRTDGKKVFLEVAETEEELRILDILNDSFVMGPVIEQSLFEAILYAEDLAYRWRPFRRAPKILLDPKIAFGRPVLEGKWVPTRTLYKSYIAEGALAAVADEFEIPEEDIEQAIAFERSLLEGTMLH